MLTTRKIALTSCALALFTPIPNSAYCGEVEVVKAQVRCTKTRTCAIQVTLRHKDEGWAHYADRWEVLTPEGQVLAKRVLRHPHVEEQPFTRMLRGVAIPAEISEVQIRAHDLVHGYGGTLLTVQISPAQVPEARQP